MPDAAASVADAPVAAEHGGSAAAEAKKPAVEEPPAVPDAAASVADAPAFGVEPEKAGVEEHPGALEGGAVSGDKRRSTSGKTMADFVTEAKAGFPPAFSEEEIVTVMNAARNLKETDRPLARKLEAIAARMAGMTSKESN